MTAASTPQRNARLQAPVSHPGPINTAVTGEQLPDAAQGVGPMGASDRVDLEIRTPRQRTRPLVRHPGLDPSDVEGMIAIYLALGYAPTELVFQPAGEIDQHLQPPSRGSMQAPGTQESAK